MMIMSVMKSVTMNINILKASLLISALSVFTFSHAVAETFWQPTNETHGQSTLPLADVVINDNVIKVELATTPRTQAYGLMNRYILPENEGMLFVFDHMQPLSFWMKNTKIPLDILYFDEEGVLVDYAYAEPCTADPCPSYPSKHLGQYVLELGKGEMDRLNIKVGDRLKKID